jgi:hypothetical protein
MRQRDHHAEMKTQAELWNAMQRAMKMHLNDRYYGYSVWVNPDGSIHVIKDGDRWSSEVHANAFHQGTAHNGVFILPTCSED